VITSISWSASQVLDPTEVGPVGPQPGKLHGVVGLVQGAEHPKGNSAQVAVAVLASAANTWAATVDLIRPQWLLVNMTKVGVPHSRLIVLAALKAAGAILSGAARGQPAGTPQRRPSRA
jgi:hypothetical protein